MSGPSCFLILSQESSQRGKLEYLVPLEWWKILLHMIKIDLHQPYNYLVPLVGGKYLHICSR